MASKWKYASLPAEERLSKIREGDKDVYESEIARSVDAANSRKELGLDTTEQRDWIDRVSYNYNLSNAGKIGISSALVNKTGYADVLLGSTDNGAKKEKRTFARTSSFAEKEGVVTELVADLNKKIADAEKQRENVVEWLLNNGIDASSEQGERFLEQADKEIAAKVESYKNSYRSELKRRLANMR